MSTKETMIKKLGGEEAYKSYLREIASRAGRQKVLKGWNARYKNIEAGKPVPPRKAVHKSS